MISNLNFEIHPRALPERCLRDCLFHIISEMFFNYTRDALTTGFVEIEENMRKVNLFTYNLDVLTKVLYTK